MKLIKILENSIDRPISLETKAYRVKNGGVIIRIPKTLMKLSSLDNEKYIKMEYDSLTDRIILSPAQARQAGRLKPVKAVRDRYGGTFIYIPKKIADEMNANHKSKISITLLADEVLVIKRHDT